MSVARPLVILYCPAASVVANPKLELAVPTASTLMLFNGVPSGVVIFPEIMPDLGSARLTFLVSTPAVVDAITDVVTWPSGEYTVTLYDPVAKLVAIRYLPLESVVADQPNWNPPPVGDALTRMSAKGDPEEASVIVPEIPPDKSRLKSIPDVVCPVVTCTLLTFFSKYPTAKAVTV